MQDADTDGGTGSACLDCRRAGILLHITSLPGPGDIGDLGDDAYRFVDFLVSSGMRVWQMLPIGPTQDDASPYQTMSVHAGNPRMISVDPVIEKGWLEGYSLDESHLSDQGRSRALTFSWEGFKERAKDRDRRKLAEFTARQGFWLDDYALFRALGSEKGGCWWEWPADLRDRNPQALAEARNRLSDDIAYLKYEQFLFFRQWMRLKHYANEKGVELFGDMPIFVAHNSAEVWAHPQMFDLQPDGQPRVVAGVPPDYFSETGQRWGNPLYRWDRMREDGFSFWVNRIHSALALFDLVRIDHFRGFEAYWEIPSGSQTAIEGHWVPSPGDDLFECLHKEFNRLPLVAEDLGVITPDVEALRDKYGLPGMRILQFAFSGRSDNPYLPFHYPRNTVVYTGTHDNDTTLGWYLELDDHTRQYVDDYLGKPREAMPWPLIRCALASRANLAILPMQDVLALNGEHRMNLPGSTEGNWLWRFEWDQVDDVLAERLRGRVKMYGR